MVKDENNVWTGKPTLPKGAKFEIQTMESTVSTTSGGVNKWSATRYKSVLNTPASYDFGEFTTSPVPNGDFDEGAGEVDAGRSNSSRRRCFCLNFTQCITAWR